MNYTEELGLKLPELDESFDLEGHWNYNTEKLDAFAATTNTAVGTLESGLSAAQSQIAALQGGVHLKGSVNYYADLPEDPDDGDAYTVLYFGTTGQEPAGIEYAWVESSQSWIPIGVDPAAFAKPADIAAAIAALDVTETGGSGKYISAISETDGKIAATPTNFDTSLSSSSTNSNAPTSKTVYDDQERQEAEIGAVANRGAKNLCPKETETSTGSGFTEDVEVNIPAGTYILSFTGTLAYTASLSLYRALPHSGNGLAAINLSAITGTQSVEFTISETAKYIAFYHNGSGNSLTNIMIRPASITDSTFQPYAKTNRELTVAEDEDRAALVEVIDGGAAGTKNHCTLASGSNTSPARWINIPVSDVGVGQWVMSFGTLTSTDTDDTLCQAICCNSSGQTVSNWVNFKREPNTNKIFTTTDNVSYVMLYSANSYATSEGDTVTFTDAMLSPKVLYDADPSYVPYAPALTNIIITPALIEQVNNGAKNLSSVSSGIISNSGGGFPIPSTPITAPIGTYIVSFRFSGNATRGSVQFRAGSTTIDSLAFDMASLVSVQIEITSDTIDNFNLYSNSTATVSEFMICTAADWAVSQKFVPYRPSWQEMWEMIQELQSGGASTQSVQPTLMSAAKAETQEQREEETDA